MAPTGQDPRVELLSLPPSGVVHQRLFLLCGRVYSGGPRDGQSNSEGPDGFVDIDLVEAKQPSFGPHIWEVNATWFKALIPLLPGNNRLKINHRWADNSPSGISHVFDLTYMPKLDRPPLHLVILAARDSPVWSESRKSGESSATDINMGTATVPDAHNPAPTIPPSHTGSQRSSGFGGFLNKVKAVKDDLAGGAFKPTPTSSSSASSSRPDQPALIDTPPGWRRDRLLNGGLREVKRRLALQALMWQAFHADQMYRQGFGHRAFSLQEQSNALHTGNSSEHIDLPSIPVVHLLRSEHTLAEFRAADNAQQHKGAKNGGAMHSFAGEALHKADFWRKGPPGAACGVLILDSTWDPSHQLLRAHAAVGSHGGLHQDSLSHGVMGSHWLWAAPSTLGEVTPAFLDEEGTDARYCCNDLGEGRTVALTINIGSGAMLHEVGHALDNPHWPSGIMARGYMEWNRAFMTRETHSIRGGNRTMKPITPDDDSRENHLHRCQAIRARLHPAFELEGDVQPAGRASFPSWKDWADVEPMFLPMRNGIRCNSQAGIAMIVIETGESGKEKKYKTHLEMGLEPSAGPPPTSYLLTPQYLSSLVGFDVLHPSSPEVALSCTAWNLRHGECNSYRRMGLAKPLTSLPGVDFMRFGREVRNGPRTKMDDDPSHHHEAILLSSAWPGGPPLVEVELFSHQAFVGLRFKYADGSAQSVGKVGNDRPKTSVRLNQGEDLLSVEVRSGWWIDAASVRVGRGSQSRDTSFVGGHGGGRRSLRPASEEEEIVGFVASSGSWMDSLGVLVADRRR